MEDGFGTLEIGEIVLTVRESILGALIAVHELVNSFAIDASASSSGAISARLALVISNMFSNLHYLLVNMSHLRPSYPYVAHLVTLGWVGRTVAPRTIELSDLRPRFQIRRFGGREVGWHVSGRHVHGLAPSRKPS